MDVLCDLLLDFYEGRRVLHPIEDKILDRYMFAKEIERLRTQRGALLAVLKDIAVELEFTNIYGPTLEKIRAAIKLAEGEG